MKQMKNIDWKLITLKYAKQIIKDIASGRIDRDKAINMCNNIIGQEFKKEKKSLCTKNTETRRKIIAISSHLKEIFVEPKT